MSNPHSATPTPLEQFLSTAVHDMKQPLNVLQMYLGILQEQTGAAREDELSLIVNGSLQSLQSMLNLLSNWARAERHSLKSQPVTVSASDWFHHLSRAGWSTPINPDPAPSGEGGERSMDPLLLTRTLRDMLALLPKGATMTLSPTPWRLEIESTQLAGSRGGERREFGDALHQLAIDGGGAVLRELGFQLQLGERDGHSVIEICPQALSVTTP